MKRLTLSALGRSSAQSMTEERLLLLAWKETLADLTPGLAHDFNNALTGILALSEAFRGQIDSKHSFYSGLSMIMQKAQQASQLVHRITQLHAEKTGTRSYEDVNSMAAEVAEVLGKVIPKRIEVRVNLATDPLPVYVDAVDFRRVLLGMMLNLAKGMADRGKLQFQTTRHERLAASDRRAAKPARLPAVCLTGSHSRRGFARGGNDFLFRAL